MNFVFNFQQIGKSMLVVAVFTQFAHCIARQIVSTIVLTL
jgi:hypothetical protein